MFDAWPTHERDANAPPLDSTGAGQLGGIIDGLLLTPFLGNYRYHHSEEPAKMWPSMTKGSTILFAC
jgi:hypothetical protein